MIWNNEFKKPGIPAFKPKPILHKKLNAILYPITEREEVLKFQFNQLKIKRKNTIH